MRNRRVGELRVEHAGQLDVGRITCAARNFRLTVPALDWLPDVLEVLVDRPYRRLGRGNVARFVAQRVPGNSDRHLHGLLVYLSSSVGRFLRERIFEHQIFNQRVFTCVNCHDAPLYALRLVPATSRVAVKILGYVPQRQRLPAMAWRTSRSVGRGFASSSAAQLITIPGVQKPHCRASCFTNATWRGCGVPSLERPSIVITRRPMASMARTLQLLTGILSSHTVQPEQEPRSQTIFVPVIPS